MKTCHSEQVFISKMEIFIVCAFVLVITSFAFRFLTEISGIVVLLVLATGRMFQRGRMVWTIAVIFWMLSLVSPVDFAVRGYKAETGRYIALLDVSSRLGQRVREKRGEIEGLHFLVYNRPSLLIPVKKVVLLTLPIDLNPLTPVARF